MSSSSDAADKPLNPPVLASAGDEVTGDEAAQPVLVKTDVTSGKKKPYTKSSSVQIQEPPVSARRGYSIVKIEEKHGLLYSAIPSMPMPLAIICLLLNLVLPGIGTLTAAFSVFCCGTTRIAKPIHAFGLNVASALLQMVTFIVIVGWIWSILWGMTFVQLCMEEKAAKQRRKDSEAVRMHYSRQESTASSRKSELI